MEAPVHLQKAKCGHLTAVLARKDIKLYVRAAAWRVSATPTRSSPEPTIPLRNPGGAQAPQKVLLVSRPVFPQNFPRKPRLLVPSDNIVADARHE